MKNYYLKKLVSLVATLALVGTIFAPTTALGIADYTDIWEHLGDNRVLIFGDSFDYMIGAESGTGQLVQGKGYWESWSSATGSSTANAELNRALYGVYVVRGRDSSSGSGAFNPYFHKAFPTDFVTNGGDMLVGLKMKTGASNSGETSTTPMASVMIIPAGSTSGKTLAFAQYGSSVQSLYAGSSNSNSETRVEYTPAGNVWSKSNLETGNWVQCISKIEIPAGAAAGSTKTYYTYGKKVADTLYTNFLPTGDTFTTEAGRISLASKTAKVDTAEWAAYDDFVVAFIPTYAGNEIVPNLAVKQPSIFDKETDDVLRSEEMFNGTARVEHKFFNLTDQDKDVIIVVAAYDEEGNMTKCEVNNTTSIPAAELKDNTKIPGNYLTTNTEIEIEETDKTLKVLVWDSLDSMKNVSSTFEINKPTLPPG